MHVAEREDIDEEQWEIRVQGECRVPGEGPGPMKRGKWMPEIVKGSLKAGTVDDIVGQKSLRVLVCVGDVRSGSVIIHSWRKFGIKSHSPGLW